MNVLLFVTVLLMAMALMTYAKIDSYRTAYFLTSQMTRYMESIEHRYANDAAYKIYTTTAMTKLEKEEEKKNTKAEGRAYLSLYYLYHDDTDDSYKQFAKAFLEKLIYTLYEDQNFFQDAVNKNPTIVNDTIEYFIRALSIEYENDRLKKIENIANIPINDKEIELFYYTMNKGTQVVSNDDEKYPRLIDFLTLDASKKLRVWLAPKEILNIMFGDEATADSIVAFRRGLYKDLKKNKEMTNEKATKTLEDECKNRLRSDVSYDYVDFTASKTDPDSCSRKIKSW